MADYLNDHKNPGTYYEVVLHRTVVEEKRVGVTVTDEMRVAAGGRKNDAGVVLVEDDRVAAEAAFAQAERHGNNGWHRVNAKEAKVAECKNKGPIVFRPRKFRGRTTINSTGRPAPQ